MAIKKRNVLLLSARVSFWEWYAPVNLLSFPFDRRQDPITIGSMMRIIGVVLTSYVYVIVIL